MATYIVHIINGKGTENKGTHDFNTLGEAIEYMDSYRCDDSDSHYTRDNYKDYGSEELNNHCDYLTLIKEYNGDSVELIHCSAFASFNVWHRLHNPTPVIALLSEANAGSYPAAVHELYEVRRIVTYRDGDDYNGLASDQWLPKVMWLLEAKASHFQFVW